MGGAVAKVTGHSVIRARNARGMRGDLLAGGRMGIALPKQPLKKAELHCECPGMSIYSEVRKGTSKASCQDSTIVLADGGYVLLGLFDGYGNLGGRVPYLLGKELDALWDGEKEEMNKYRLKHMLERAAIQALVPIVMSVNRRRGEQRREEMEKYEKRGEQRKTDPELTPIPKPAEDDFDEFEELDGGSTATLVAMMPDGRFFAVGVGDSALYKADPDGTVTRLFTFDEYWSEEERRMMSIKGILSPKKYSLFRNILASSVCARELNDMDIEMVAGTLDVGGMLILVSDGITKNLLATVGGDGMIEGTDGICDIRRITGAVHSAEGVGMATMDLARDRALLGWAGAPVVIKRGNGMVLMPADDDGAVNVLKRTG